MKNTIMKTHKKLIFLMGVACCIGCNDLIKDYKLDTNPDFLNSVTLLDYIEQRRDTTLTMYAEAIKYASLQESISGGNKTRIVPTNNAIRTVLLSAGVSRIQDLSPNVVKGLFSYLTIPGVYKSVDLKADQTIAEETAGGDLLYLTRNASGQDRYHLLVNRSAELATQPIDVIRQDYVFMDGIAHVVDYFPVYQQSVKPTDAVPGDVDYTNAKKDTLWATDDAHAYTASKTMNYNTVVNQLVSRSGQLRYTFLKFNVKAIDFAEDITSAKLNFFVNVINGSNYVPFCGIYETAGTWTGPTLTWNTKPDFGQEVVTTDLALNWNSINMTAYIQNAYKDNKAVVSLGLQLLNGANVTSSSVQILNMEASGGIYKQYISLMGSIPSEIQLNSTSPLTVESNGITALTKNHVSMSGSSTKYKYTDNNIIYVLMTPPVYGTLTKYGLPMVKYTQFTQEELSNGAVKYVHNGTGNSDAFQLKAQDYIGGVFPDLVQISVAVQ